MNFTFLTCRTIRVQSAVRSCRLMMRSTSERRGKRRKPRPRRPGKLLVTTMMISIRCTGDLGGFSSENCQLKESGRARVWQVEKKRKTGSLSFEENTKHLSSLLPSLPSSFLPSGFSLFPQFLRVQLVIFFLLFTLSMSYCEVAKRSFKWKCERAIRFFAAPPVGNKVKSL